MLEPLTNQPNEQAQLQVEFAVLKQEYTGLRSQPTKNLQQIEGDRDQEQIICDRVSGSLEHRLWEATATAP